MDAQPEDESVKYLRRVLEQLAADERYPKLAAWAREALEKGEMGRVRPKPKRKGSDDGPR